MTFNPDIHHRRSIRLKGYDYSQHGLYYITICIQNRECLLGEIVDGHMHINPCGEMVEKWVVEIENKYDNVKIVSYVIMPNHLHAIISNDDIPGEHIGSPLHRIVQWFKTMTTNEYIRNIKTLGWKSFDRKLWQRNYYEHIIRDEQSYLEIAEYIQNNPKNWKEDTLFT